MDLDRKSPRVIGAWGLETIQRAMHMIRSTPSIHPSIHPSIDPLLVALIIIIRVLKASSIQGQEPPNSDPWGQKDRRRGAGDPRPDSPRKPSGKPPEGSWGPVREPSWTGPGEVHVGTMLGPMLWPYVGSILDLPKIRFYDPT